jgi:hypothetical protein
MSSINDRFAALISSKTLEGRRFKELEERTKISAVSWRKAFNGGQRPTAEMIEAVARLWPQHAFWLATGVTDNEFSHSAPDGSSALDTANQARPAGEQLLQLRVELDGLLKAEKRSLIARWEDWLTAQQEQGREKYPWLYSVHPSLARRKAENQRRAKERDDRVREVVEIIDNARRKRIAEFLAIYGHQEN